MERDFERGTRQHCLDPAEIGDRLRSVRPRLITNREGPKAVQASTGHLLAESPRRCFLEPIRPAAAGLGELSFERRHVDRRYPASRGPDDKMDPGQRRFVDLGIKGRDPAGERFLEDRRNAAAQLAVIALARYIDQTRDKALQWIAADEYGYPLALLQIENTGNGIEQLVLVGLEQFVAWIGVEDVQERLAVVTSGRQPGAFDDVTDFEPQQRYRSRIAAVGERGKQSDKNVNADDFAAWREPADADRVHVRSAVNRCTTVRFGDDDKLAPADKILHVAGQGGKVAQAPKHGMSFVAQNSQRSVLSVSRSGERVFAISEKGEVVVVEPTQKVQHFRELGSWNRRRLH